MYIIEEVCGIPYKRDKKGMFVVFGVLFSKKLYNHQKIGKKQDTKPQVL
jgi:hypothetical protein